MSMQEITLMLARCDQCGLPDMIHWPGFETEEEAEEVAVKDSSWIMNNNELTCEGCVIAADYNDERTK